MYHALTRKMYRKVVADILATSVYVAVAIFEAGNLVFGRGYFFLGDQGFPLYFQRYIHYVFSPWNFQVGSSNGAISYPVLLPSMALNAMSLSPELTDGLIAFLLYALSGIVFYFSAKWLIIQLDPGLKSSKSLPLAMLLGGLLFMLNFYTWTNALLVEITVAYDAFPIFVASTLVMIISGLSARRFFASSISLLFLISGAPEYALTGALLVIAISVMMIFFHNLPILKCSKRMFLLILGFLPLIVYSGIATYGSVASEYVPSPVQSNSFNQYELGPASYGSIFNVIRVLSLNFWNGGYSFGNSVSVAGGLLILSIALLGFLFFRNPALSRQLKQFYITATVLYLLIFLTMVRYPPFLGFSTLIAGTYFSSGLLWDFYRNPNNYAIALVYLVSLLLAISIIIILRSKFLETPDSKRQVYITVSIRRSDFSGAGTVYTFSLTKLVFTGLIVFLLLSSLFMLSLLPAKESNSYNFQKIDIPEPYYAAGSYLINNSYNGLKSWWLPPSYNQHPIFSWAPDNGRPSSWAEDVSPTPILFPSDQNSYSYLNYLYYQQLDGMLLNDTGMLAPLGVQYVVVHSDQYPIGNFASYPSAQRLNQTLKSQSGMKLVFNESFISIYSTKFSDNMFYAATPAVVVGGPDVSLLLSDAGVNMSEFGLFYLPELNSAGMAKSLAASRLIFLGPHQNMTTFFLDTQYSQQINPASYYGNGGSASGWVVAPALNTIIQRLEVYSGFFAPWSGEPPSGGELIATNAPGATITFPLVLHSGLQDVWLKALSSPFSGKISINIGNNFSRIVNLYSNDSSYMKWIDVGSIGEQSITTTKVKITSIGGMNAVNLILPLSGSDLTSGMSSFLRTVADKPIFTVSFKMISNSYGIPIVSILPSPLVANNLYGNGHNGDVAQTFLIPSSNISAFEVRLGNGSNYNGTHGNLLINLTTTNITGAPADTTLKSWLVNGTSLTIANTPVYLPLSNISLVADSEYALTFQQVDAKNDSSALFLYVAKSLFPYNNYTQGYFWGGNSTGWSRATGDIWLEIFAPHLSFTNNTLKAKTIEVAVRNLMSSTSDVNVSPSELNSEFGVTVQQRVTWNYSSNAFHLRIMGNNPSYMLVMTQNYNPGWALRGEQPLPADFILNGYLIGNTTNNAIVIHYAPSFSYYTYNFIGLGYFVLMAAIVAIPELRNAIIPFRILRRIRGVMFGGKKSR